MDRKAAKTVRKGNYCPLIVSVRILILLVIPFNLVLLLEFFLEEPWAVCSVQLAMVALARGPRAFRGSPRPGLMGG